MEIVQLKDTKTLGTSPPPLEHLRFKVCAEFPATVNRVAFIVWNNSFRA